MPKLKIKFADYIIAGTLLVWGLVGFWFNLQEVSAVEHKYAVIYVQNRQVVELSLISDDHFSYSFQFGDENEHTAVVEIQEGRIRMLPLDEELCPQGICAHTGWIVYSYESIVCLPNQIMVVFTENTTDGNKEDIDGITY